MKMTELILDQLTSEGPRTRRALENVPAGRDDWKPHAKSMPFGRLAQLVATMPTWFSLVLNKDELDLKPAGGSNIDQKPLRTSAELVAALDKGMAEASDALRKTTDEHLMTPWKLLVAGQVVEEKPRHVVLRETLMHLAHHRGQLTVYLRLNDAPVPSIYGPTADDARFA